VITQQQADALIAMAKEADRDDVFVWEINQSQNETMEAVENRKIQFVLSLKRSPYRIRLHCRTRDRDIGLVRVDDSLHHINPDGTEIRNQPHIHIYREGYPDLVWAEPIDWYDVHNPMATLQRFLDEIRGRFPNGYQLSLL